MSSTQLVVPQGLRRLGSALYAESLDRSARKSGAPTVALTKRRRSPPPPDATDSSSWLMRAAHSAACHQRMASGLGITGREIARKWESLHGITRGSESFRTVRGQITCNQATDSVTIELKKWVRVCNELYEDTRHLEAKVKTALIKGGIWMEHNHIQEFGDLAIKCIYTNDTTSESDVLDWLQKSTPRYAKEKLGLYSQPEILLTNAARRDNPEFDRAIRDLNLTCWGDRQQLLEQAPILWPVFEKFEDSLNYSFLDPPKRVDDDLWALHQELAQERAPPSSPDAFLCPSNNTYSMHLTRAPTPVATGWRLPNTQLPRDNQRQRSNMGRTSPDCTAPSRRSTNEESHPVSSAQPPAWSVRNANVTAPLSRTLSSHQEELLAKLINGATAQSETGCGHRTADGLANEPARPHFATDRPSSPQTDEQCQALLSLWALSQNAKATQDAQDSQICLIGTSAAYDEDNEGSARLRKHRYGLQRDLEVTLANARADAITAVHRAGYSLPWMKSEDRCIEVCDNVLERLGAPPRSTASFQSDPYSHIEGVLESSGCHWATSTTDHTNHGVRPASDICTSL